MTTPGAMKVAREIVSEYAGYCVGGRWMPLVESIAAAVKAAREEEREACAVIAETMTAKMNPFAEPHENKLYPCPIAAAIRARKDTA